MNQKKQKAAGGKATDITAPKKQAVGTAPLVIPKRSIIGQQTADAEATEMSENETPIVTQPTTRKTILPVTVTDGSETDPPADVPSTPGASTDAPEEAKTPEPAAAETPKPEALAEAETPAPVETPASAPATDAAPDEPEETDTDTEESETPKPKTKEELQAEQTAEAVKRERELQEYIKNQKYFVPVNAAEKKSIRVSFGLVALLLLLAFVLIDLLLDTGAILLIQKIPHTHFFNLYH